MPGYIQAKNEHSIMWIPKNVVIGHQGKVRRRINAKGYGTTKNEERKEELRALEVSIVNLNKIYTNRYHF